jgi:hypothetical protein
LHDFIIFNKAKPIINLVQREEDIVYPANLPMVTEAGVKIDECIPKYKRLLYRYGFGKGWEHTIGVEDFIFDYDKNYPVCLDGEGSAPPEDIGGEGEYKDFLEKMNNPAHENHREIKQWANRQRYREYDIDFINLVLKHLL